MANYVSISHREMQDFMEALGFRELTVEERSGRYATGKLRVVRERVFERPLGEGFIRVYSSVVGPDSRRKGRDAIRVQYWVDGVKVYGTQRVHRVVNWRRNLLQRIYELDDLVSKGALRRVPRDSAGQPMVVRTAKKTGKKFWGSSNYPRNRDTRRFGAETPWPIQLRRKKHWPPTKLLRFWVDPEESGERHGYFRYERVPLTPAEMENNLANFCEVCGVGNAGYTTERGVWKGFGGGMKDIGTEGPDGKKESFWICRNCEMDMADAWQYLFGREKKSFDSEVDESVANQCPYCGEDDIIYVDHFEDGYITVGCNICGSQWFEVWKFMGIELENGREGWEAEDMTNEEDDKLVKVYEDNWFQLHARTPTGQDYTMYPLNVWGNKNRFSIKGVEDLVDKIGYIFDNLGDAPNPYAIDIFTTEDGRKELIGIIKYGQVEPSGKFWPAQLSKLLNRRLDFVRSAENTEDDFIWDEEAGVFYDYMMIEHSDEDHTILYWILNEDLENIGEAQLNLTPDEVMISSIFIHPVYQRQGIATHFVNHVEYFWDNNYRTLNFSDAVSEEGAAFIDSFAAAGKYPANDVRSWLKEGQTVWWIDPDEPQNRTNWKISESWEEDYGDAIPEDDEIIWIYTDEGSEAEVPLHEIRLRRHLTGYVGQTCNFCGRNKIDLKAVGDKLIRTKRPTSWDVVNDEPMSIGSVLSCQECEQTIDDFDWANHAMYNFKWWD
tara:strand:- start:3660 stop:5822 length:2163 start_codon:yes stop_codon:yes gene_type:complete